MRLEHVRPTVLCSAGMPDRVMGRLARFGEVLVVADDEESLRRHAEQAVAIAARASARVTAAVIEAAPALRVIGRSGVGVDNVDVAAASRRGIPVVVTPGATTRAVAEGAIAMVLSLAKRLPVLDGAVKRGDWAARDSVDILDLDGCTLGVVGLGRVGRRVAELAAALGFVVLAHEPYPTAETPQRVPLVGLDDLVRRCEVVVLTAALTPASRGVIDGDVLRRCGPGAILVNVSRGELVSSLDDLCDALSSGRLAGVGLDVFATEPPDPEHPLLRDERVLTSPHALAFTRRGRSGIFDDMADGMAEVLAGGRPAHVADPSVYASREEVRKP